jgi:toxin-antitoxin system PIN domain toxin
MIVPDVNLLIYANIAAMPEHDSAKAWMEESLSGGEPVGLALPVLFGFIRISTSRRVFDPPLALDDALGRIEAWLERPHVTLLAPGPRHLEIAFALLRTLGSAGTLTTDVQLAALAIEHQALLVSHDTDFGRFLGCAGTDPLRP